MGWDLFQQGGLVMYPLLVCSVLALGISLERAFSLRRSRIIRPEIVSVIQNIKGPEDIGLAHSVANQHAGPFAQVIRYEAKRDDRRLGSAIYDFYKICLQDHAILAALNGMPELSLSPFSLYIITHELIHIVRFCKFLQNFDASPEERLIEEGRVHASTHDILSALPITGMQPVFEFYDQWRRPIDRLN